MKKSLKTLCLIMTFSILFLVNSSKISATTIGTLAWNPDTGKMESSITGGTSSDYLEKNGTGFKSLGYNYKFNFEENKNFEVDLSINVRDSTQRISLFSFNFVGKTMSLGYSNSKVIFSSLSFEMDLSNETDFKVHFNYDIETSTLYFNSLNYPEISGSIVQDSLLNGITFGKTNNFNYYNSFKIEFDDGEAELYPGVTEKAIIDGFTKEPNSVSPNYGSGNVSAIKKWIEEKKYLEYGRYYICQLTNLTHNTSCYVFDDVTQISFIEEYALRGNMNITAPYTVKTWMDGSEYAVTHNEKDGIIYSYDTLLNQNLDRVYRTNILEYILTGKIGNFHKVENNNSLQLYSLDFYIDKKDNLSNFYYEVDYTNKNENGLNSRFNGTSLYGLVNENGLYHWEQIEITSDLLDVNSDYSYSKLKDDGFVEANAYVISSLFEQYEKIKFSLDITNAFQYEMTINVPDTVSKDSIFENFVDKQYFLLEHDTSIYRYVLFTTKNRNLNEKIYLNGINNDIFMDIFDTETLKFFEYDYFSKFLYQDEWLYNNYTIGLENKRGFYFTPNKGYSLKYRILHSINLYYSFNNNDYLDNSIFIDSEGNISNGNISISPDDPATGGINYLYKQMNDYLAKLQKKSNGFNRFFHVFWDNMPALLQDLIYFAFLMLLVFALFYMGGF